MDNNNDFDRNINQSDLDEYVANELLKHYGEDVMNSVRREYTPSVPTKPVSNNNNLFSVASVICATAFLTGVVIFLGVIFTSGIPVISISTPDMAESTSSEFSSEIIPDTESPDTPVFTNSEISSEIVSDKESDDTPAYTNSSGNLSNVESKNSSVYTEKSETNENVENPTEFYSKSESAYSDTSSKSDTLSRPTYYSLPEIPDEGTVTSVHTDLDNNSITNPNDNVTTGKRIRIGVGVFLMLMSLAVSIVLNKVKYSDNKEI